MSQKTINFIFSERLEELIPVSEDGQEVLNSLLNEQGFSPEETELLHQELVGFPMEKDFIDLLVTELRLLKGVIFHESDESQASTHIVPVALMHLSSVFLAVDILEEDLEFDSHKQLSEVPSVLEAGRVVVLIDLPIEVFLQDNDQPRLKHLLLCKQVLVSLEHLFFLHSVHIPAVLELH
eukprot:CAMPEP_0170483886 /NCGR_PEP_ID=MMETSP0208-20121228/3480_1 /TAXON_ID=197538 /ORGANISM="Strombidium inclinatum, Strain S3" /LENGTH=179 /DNA_ID=CAMNT_0010757081 /DNA_START=2443 /DNA_END=2982 /DNA_ORIENTATION=+